MESCHLNTSESRPPAQGHPSPKPRASPSSSARSFGPLPSSEWGGPKPDPQARTPNTQSSCIQAQGHPSSSTPYSPDLPSPTALPRCQVPPAPSSGVPATTVQLPTPSRPGPPLTARSTPRPRVPSRPSSPPSPASRSVASRPCCYYSRRPPPPPPG